MGKRKLTHEEELAKLKAQSEAWQAKQKAREEAEDKKFKSEGYKFKLSAWVHPKNGGDDYRKVIYYGEQPTEKEIARVLSRSAVKTDYRVVEL